MEKLNTKSLYELYIQESGSNLDEQYFESLLLYFPCLVVASCDGIIDDEEWVYVRYLAKFMAERHKDAKKPKELEFLKNTYFRELQFLAMSINDWKDHFIQVLRDYLDEHDWLKDDIEDILEAFADASDGISPEEEEALNYLREELQI
ncbi:hypothetical protein V6R21_14720 [Limibacter armeniacum]|uniref:hypothetical protein n=1 Tax=Limibacter armeniacum TaxID=466084 RepID=UPI002FE524DB